MEKTNRPILGTTLFSFTNEWQKRTYDLDGLLHKVVELGVGPAVEIVGFQSIRGFPDVTPEFAKHFRNLLDSLELVPSCLGANLDIGIRKDRLMTPDETEEYIRRQIVSARMLGFPVVRIQAFAKPEVLDRIIPIAERTGVHVASELHSPLTVDHPTVVELLEYYRKIQCPALGFIPDFSSVITFPPEVFWRSMRRIGATEELIERAKDIWKMKVPSFEKFKALADACEEHGASSTVSRTINRLVTMFGNMPVSDLRELLPYVRHIHGKFYEVTPDSVEPSIPYPEIMALLKDFSYTGTISAEWEGAAFIDEPISFEQVQRWHVMCKRLLAS